MANPSALQIAFLAVHEVLTCLNQRREVLGLAEGEQPKTRLEGAATVYLLAKQYAGGRVSRSELLEALEVFDMDKLFDFLPEIR